MNTLFDFIKLLADDVHHSIMRDGKAPAGHNGPYLDPESPVRNSGHWLITFSRLYRATEEKKYLQAVEVCANYLASDAARPFGYTFLHRTKAGKDACNGLVGQAWTIEALMEAYRVTGDSIFLALAEEVFHLHDFHDATGLWYRREIDGARLSLDATFNHQLWFAAAGGLIGTPSVTRKVLMFLDKLQQTLVVYDNGLIHHPVAFRAERSAALAQVGLADRIRKRARWIVGDFLGKSPRLYQKETAQYAKCIGYHAFNTYAFALLRIALPNHAIWKTELIKSIIRYLQSDEYLADIEAEQVYGFNYNAPGFEVPFSLYGLAGADSEELAGVTKKWMRKQLDITWNKKDSRFHDRVPDKTTLAARIYEITRLPQDVLERVRFE